MGCPSILLNASPYCLQKVGLAASGFAVEIERVEQGPWRFTDGSCGPEGQCIARVNDEILEGKLRLRRKRKGELLLFLLLGSLKKRIGERVEGIHVAPDRSSSPGNRIVENSQRSKKTRNPDGYRETSKPHEQFIHRVFPSVEPANPDRRGNDYSKASRPVMSRPMIKA